MASLYLIKKFDTIEKLLEQIDLGTIDSLPLTYNFLGNFWRLSALFHLTQALENSDKLSE